MDHRRNGLEPRRTPAPAVPPSGELIASGEEVTITENHLRKRKIEFEAEQVEDQFRERDRRREAEQATEKRRATEAAARAEHQQWVDRWLKYALDSIPSDAPREVELDVHQSVQEALAKLQSNQPYIIVRRLVDAATEKALSPWRRGQAVDKVVAEAVERLPWDARSC